MLKRKFRIVSCVVASIMMVTLISCDGNSKNNTNSNNVVTDNDVNYDFSKIDMSKWQYNADDNVYYQIGIQYCEKPADLDYEKLSIFVPGDYMKAKDNGDGTFSCEINKDSSVGNYNAQNAPIVIPVDTPGYMACKALTDYTNVSNYTNAGFIYVHAGCRGREQGAPAGVTDLKAAIRYIRYNDGVIAGDINRIFSFGMSGGGAQSALLGSTGDSQMYDDYLNAIGAVQNVSDSVAGSMCWCPITSLDSADAAYEWNMGTTRNNLSEQEQKISINLSTSFASYINKSEIKDENGNVLELIQSADGRYQAGSYYDYIKSVIEKSLNNFLADTTFPYNADETSKKGIGGHQGEKIKNGDIPDKKIKDGDMPNGMKDKEDNFEDKDNISRSDSSGDITISGTYQTIQDYIDALNKNTKWVNYDSQSNTATITSIEDFAKAVKPASKGIAAFDQLDAGQGENVLFGYGDGKGAHFDSMMPEILKGSEYESVYSEAMTKQDDQGKTVQDRVNMYSPLYYLLKSNAGYGKSTVAQYWRIRTGAWQSDTSLTTETNLALALKNYAGVKNVDYETVWGQKHTEAERSGNSSDNFINWVNDCVDTYEK